MFQILHDANEITTNAILTPLKGGVSSDICLVEDRGEKWVAKRALEKREYQNNDIHDHEKNVDTGCR